MQWIWTALRWFWKVSAGLGTLLMFGSQVGPDDAVSNLSKWTAKFLDSEPPAWLKSPTVDNWFFWGGVALVVIGVSLGLWLGLRAKRPRTAPKPVAPSTMLSLSDEAQAVAQRINVLGATYPAWMPDKPGYKEHNEVAEAHFMRAYREQISTEAQRVMEAAKRRGLLASEDGIYRAHTAVGRGAVEEIGRVMLRIAVAGTMPGSDDRSRSETVVTLSATVEPMLKGSFSMGNQSCVVRGVPVISSLSGQELERRDYFRLEVTAHGAVRVSNCRGRLLWVERDGERVFSDPIDLPFAPSHLDDAFSKTIHRDVPEYLDVLAIDHFDQVKIVAPNLPTSLPQTLFWGEGTYRLRVAILSEAPAIQGDLVLDWKEYRRTANITYNEVIP